METYVLILKWATGILVAGIIYYLYDYQYGKNTYGEQKGKDIAIAWGVFLSLIVSMGWIVVLGLDYKRDESIYKPDSILRHDTLTIVTRENEVFKSSETNIYKSDNSEIFLKKTRYLNYYGCMLMETWTIVLTNQVEKGE